MLTVLAGVSGAGSSLQPEPQVFGATQDPSLGGYEVRIEMNSDGLVTTRTGPATELTNTVTQDPPHKLTVILELAELCKLGEKSLTKPQIIQLLARLRHPSCPMSVITLPKEDIDKLKERLPTMSDTDSATVPNWVTRKELEEFAGQLVDAAKSLGLKVEIHDQTPIVCDLFDRKISHGSIALKFTAKGGKTVDEALAREMIETLELEMNGTLALQVVRDRLGRSDLVEVVQQFAGLEKSALQLGESTRPSRHVQLVCQLVSIVCLLFCSAMPPVLLFVIFSEVPKLMPHGNVTITTTTRHPANI